MGKGQLVGRNWQKRRPGRGTDRELCVFWDETACQGPASRLSWGVQRTHTGAWEGWLPGRAECGCCPPEYVEHLKDEAAVCAIIDRVQRYLEEKGTTEEVCRVYLRRILHTYYKFDYKAHQRQLTLPEGASKVSADGVTVAGTGTCQDAMAKLPFSAGAQGDSGEAGWGRALGR